MDGDDLVDVVEERSQPVGFLGAEVAGGDVPPQAIGLTDHVAGRPGPLGDQVGDAVGTHLEVPAVERHDAEAVTDGHLLVHPRVGEQLGEQAAAQETASGSPGRAPGAARSAGSARSSGSESWSGRAAATRMLTHTIATVMPSR